MTTPIHDFLSRYSSLSPVRCHMPGGKENPIDITEIEGADSLFDCSGIIKQSEENAAGLFGSEKTLYSCGGSTLSIQTMLALAKAGNPKKNRVAASRYCHKSLVSSCILLGLEVDWIETNSFLSCQVSAGSVKEKINDNTLCVFVQSIDYYGGECDIYSISKVCREHNIPLLTDNAHGAYKVLTHNHPLRRGADMTADSAHKTLPCLTGTAYLHISKSAPKIFSQRAKEMMSIFGSSSPSYLMLDSLDLCNLHISEEKEKAEFIFENVDKLKKGFEDIGYSLRKSDKMRITIDAENYGFSGFDLSKKFEEKKIYCEYSDLKYLVLLFSTAQPLGDFEKILKAAKEIEKKQPFETEALKISLPPKAKSLREAVFSESEEVPLQKALGRICSSLYAPCPPCVPVIMPGEVYTEEIVKAFSAWGVDRVRVVV